MNRSKNATNEFIESDWKLFRSKIGGWQENYLDGLIKEYLKLLTQEKQSSEKFWTLEKRINKDKRKSGAAIELRRSTMILSILELLHDEVIEMEDLNDFSPTLKATINFYKN